MEINWFPLWLSLRVALLATAFSLAVGVWIAYLLANRQFRGKELVDAAVTLPLVLPPTVLGYYLLVLLSRESALGRLFESITGGPLVFTWKAAVLAAMVHSTPLLVKLVRAALETVDRTYEKAARNLGANEWRVFWRISLPLARRPVFAAAVLAFARSLGDFGITIMLAGNIPNRTQTISVAIYDAVEAGSETTALVLVLAISAIALVSVYVANRWNEGRALR
ncbi:MAG: molybdate ABC transporter permease subunit [Bryobacterales bacterium]|nr:molybdate ABC transporter permease subunit [Bryobacterales bacterium]